jgi:hypothetical protein
MSMNQTIIAQWEYRIIELRQDAVIANAKAEELERLVNQFKVDKTQPVSAAPTLGDILNQKEKEIDEYIRRRQVDEGSNRYSMIRDIQQTFGINFREAVNAVNAVDRVIGN